MRGGARSDGGRSPGFSCDSGIAASGRTRLTGGSGSGVIEGGPRIGCIPVSRFLTLLLVFPLLLSLLARGLCADDPGGADGTGFLRLLRGDPPDRGRVAIERLVSQPRLRQSEILVGEQLGAAADSDRG